MAMETPENNPGRVFTMTREFAAPRAVVWAAFTEADRLAQWWGPTGFTFIRCTLELTRGGAFHFGMRSPDGGEMWARFVYEEITVPEKLVYVSSFSDKEGSLQAPPFDDEWPMEIRNTFLFNELAGKTTVTLHSVPVNPTETARATFESGFDSMNQGYGGTFDQLVEYLRHSGEFIH